MRKTAIRAEKTLRHAGVEPLSELHFSGDLVSLVAAGMHPDDPRRQLSILKHYPQTGSAVYRLARAGLYERLGELRKACADYEFCLNIKGARDFQTTSVRPLVGLARLAMLGGSLEQAARLTWRALLYNFRDIEALFAGVSLARLGGSLLGFVTQYKNQFGDSSELHQALGDDALSVGEPSQAISELQAAVDMDSSDDRLKLRLAQALLADGQVELAAEHARILNEQLPEASMGVLVCDLLLDQDSSLEVDLELAALERALRTWVDVLKKSPNIELIDKLKQAAPVVEHLFPWLSVYLAA
jgi:tetratricopeptide (TPR) repeat protein